MIAYWAARYFGPSHTTPVTGGPMISPLFRAITCFVMVTLLAGVGSAAEPAPDIRVMTFNIRFGTANDGVNHWDKRKEFLIETIKAFDPDLLGTQETLGF